MNKNLLIEHTSVEQLVQCAWKHHERAWNKPWLRKPSIPILYFGDLKAYRESALRVVTVALNPSGGEFPDKAPFKRFPSNSPSLEKNHSAYVDALNGYFRKCPLKKWFASFEKGLKGLGTSYYDGQASNTALHTDLLSCLATDPTWSKLDKKHPGLCSRLADEGVPLWHDLMKCLQPDVVLLSLAKEWRKCIHFPSCSDWCTAHTFLCTKLGESRKYPIKIEYRWHVIKGRRTLFAFAPAANTPLGKLNHPQKVEAGCAIRRIWDAHQE